MTKKPSNSLDSLPLVPSAKSQVACFDKDLANDLLKLTDQQRRYVEARAQGLSTHASATFAGVDDHHRSAMERHPRVKKILQETARFALRRLAVSREDVLDGFMDAVHASQTSTELTAAWREIGRLVGAYEPEQVKHTHIHKTAEQMEQLSDEELLKMADQEGFTLDGEYEVSMDDDFPDELEVTELDEVGIDLPRGGDDGESA